MKLFVVGLVGLAAIAACQGKQQDNAKTLSKSRSVTKATVARVTDGDTIHVTINGQDKTVRLIGIDTPETHKPGVSVECDGLEASANMKRLAPAGAKATLTADSTQDSMDRYGRMLAYVSVNRHQLQLGQLSAGLAEVYVYRGKPFQRVDSFNRAEGAAQRARRGVWGSCSGDFHSEQPEN